MMRLLPTAWFGMTSSENNVIGSLVGFHFVWEHEMSIFLLKPSRHIKWKILGILDVRVAFLIRCQILEDSSLSKRHVEVDTISRP